MFIFDFENIVFPPEKPQNYNFSIFQLFRDTPKTKIKYGKLNIFSCILKLTYEALAQELLLYILLVYIWQQFALGNDFKTGIAVEFTVILVLIDLLIELSKTPW